MMPRLWTNSEGRLAREGILSMWPTFLVGGHVCLQNNSLEGTPVWIHGVSCLRTIGLVISYYPLASLNKTLLIFSKCSLKGQRCINVR